MKTTEGRRTSSRSSTYVYDSEDIILEYIRKDGSPRSRQEVVRFTHGPGIDEPISMERRNKLYYYHFDGLGSVTELTNSRQRTVERLDYDSFGIPRRYGTLFSNPYAYTGREYDPEIGLYYYRNRYYDPAIGRFITQDPLGMVDGPNLYTYCSNNPVNWVDPWGWRKGTSWFPRPFNIFVPGYRSYGGPTRSGPWDPEDLMDVAFQRHDIGYRSGELDQADLQLLYDLSNLPRNPRYWGEGINVFYARLYRIGAYIIFASRQVIVQTTKDISAVFH